MKIRFILLLAFLPHWMFAQLPCAFDNTFNGNGKLVSDGSRLLEHIVALPNGQSIVVYNPFGNGHTYLRRLNNDGTIDNTFGTGGKTTIQVANLRTDVKDLMVYNNQIYCCGSTGTGNDTYPFWARFSIDGVPDNTFATNGIGTNPQHYTYNSMKVEPGTGKILIGGMKGTNEIVVVRIHTSGYTDGNFGNLGEATFKTLVNGEYYETHHLNLDNNNKIILTGKYYVTQGNTFAKLFVARLNADGTKDNTFDMDGIAVYSSAAGNYDDGRRIFANTANDYYICGASWRAGQDYDYTLTKVKNNASLDNSFDQDGWKFYDIGGTSQEEYCFNGAMMQNGNILLTGNQGSGDTVHFCMLMVKPDGSRDNNFAPNGVFKHIFGVNNNNSSSALALTPDGKILLGGYTRTCANGTCGPLSSGVARYTGGQMATGIPQISANNSTHSFYPTLIAKEQWINIEGPSLDARELKILDMSGRNVAFSLDTRRLKLINAWPGVYFVSIANKNNTRPEVIKVVVVE